MTDHSDTRPPGTRRPDTPPPGARHSNASTPGTEASYTERHGPTDLEATPEYARAVAEAEGVLATRWPRWAADQGLDPVPTLRRGPPQVSLVGTDPATLVLVAVLAFAFDSDGRTFHGLARGPAEAGLFRIRPAPGAAVTTSRSRWGRRRDR